MHQRFLPQAGLLHWATFALGGPSASLRLLGVALQSLTLPISSFFLASVSTCVGHAVLQSVSTSLTCAALPLPPAPPR